MFQTTFITFTPFLIEHQLKQYFSFVTKKRGFAKAIGLFHASFEQCHFLMPENKLKSINQDFVPHSYQYFLAISVQVFTKQIISHKYLKSFIILSY